MIFWRNSIDRPYGFHAPNLRGISVCSGLFSGIGLRQRKNHAIRSVFSVGGPVYDICEQYIGDGVFSQAVDQAQC